jgi:phenylpropionate dioxygenase-like ring-hydroxylating dioxygenase large terminal subunit
MFLSLTSDLKSGEARPLVQYQNKRFLANDSGSYKIGSNVCPHQSSRIINNKTDNIVCQYHGWSWDLQGNPTGAGYTKVCNSKKINMVDAFENQGLVLSSPIDLPKLPISFDMFELKDHRVDRVQVDDPKHIMNIFLDVDHIPLVHRHVYDRMGIVGDADVEWEYFENGSIQKVYHSTDKNRPLIFMWLAIYPYTMIEWQPGSMFITDCFNTEHGRTDVAVYKYKEHFSSNYEYETNQQTWEVAWKQDKFQSEQMVAINSAMFEEQKQHYLRWINLNGTSFK